MPENKGSKSNGFAKFETKHKSKIHDKKKGQNTKGEHSKTEFSKLESSKPEFSKTSNSKSRQDNTKRKSSDSNHKTSESKWKSTKPKNSQSPSFEKRFVSMIKKVKVTQTYLPYVVMPPCPIFDKCGGCQLQMFNYEGHLKYKYSNLIDLLGSFGKVENIEPMAEPYYYRHKTHASFSYSMDRQKRIVAGIYEENTHKVVETENCLIQDQRANEIIKSVKTLMPKFRMLAYDEDQKTGFLRHLLIRTAYASKEVMVVIVGGTPIFPQKKNFTKALMASHPEITTVVFNINPSKTSMILGQREEILAGKGYLEDTLCGYKFKISPKAFYQVNPEQTEKLYNKAIEFAELTGNERVLDAYSGIGTIGMVASSKAKEVVSVEYNKDAVKDAIRSARENKVENIYFYQADATEFITSVAAEGAKFDVIFMDPPRHGSTPEFIKAIGKLKPKRIVYVSCGPEALKRDLELLVKQGYKVDKIKPFDMFPWTDHVETVCLLTRK